jgi:hypothetical protein
MREELEKAKAEEDEKEKFQKEVAVPPTQVEKDKTKE